MQKLCHHYHTAVESFICFHSSQRKRRCVRPSCSETGVYPSLYPPDSAGLAGSRRTGHVQRKTVLLCSSGLNREKLMCKQIAWEVISLCLVSLHSQFHFDWSVEENRMDGRRKHVVLSGVTVESDGLQPHIYVSTVHRGDRVSGRFTGGVLELHHVETLTGGGESLHILVSVRLVLFHHIFSVSLNVLYSAGGTCFCGREILSAPCCAASGCNL